MVLKYLKDDYHSFTKFILENLEFDSSRRWDKDEETHDSLSQETNIMKMKKFKTLFSSKT